MSKNSKSSEEKVDKKKTTSKSTKPTKDTKKTDTKKTSVDSKNKESKTTSTKKDSNQNKKVKNSNRLMNILGGSFAAVLLLLAILFVPIGAQSNLSRLLDTFNAHQLAFAVDQVYRGNVSFSADDLRQQSCTRSYIDYDQQVRVLMLQGNQSAELYAMDDQYNDKFNLEIAADGLINANQQATRANLSADIYANSEITEGEELTVKGEFNNVTTTDGSYVKVEGFEDYIQQLGQDINAESGVYYKADFQELYQDVYPESNANLPEEIKIITTAVDDILTFNPSELLEESVYQETSDETCNTLEGIEFIVEEPTDISFTSPSGSTELYVRPVSFRIDDITKLNLDSLTEDSQADFFESDKPFEYAKSQYDNVKTIVDSVNRIVPPVEYPVYEETDYSNLPTDESGFPVFPEPTYEERPLLPELTKEDYEEGIENSKELLRASPEDGQPVSSPSNQEILDELEKNLEGIDYTVDIQTYFDMRSGDIVAYGIKAEAKFNDDAINRDFSDAPEVVKNILRSGIVAQASTWNIRVTEGVDEVQVPTDFKPGSELLNPADERKAEEQS